MGGIQGHWAFSPSLHVRSRTKSKLEGIQGNPLPPPQKTHNLGALIGRDTARAAAEPASQGSCWPGSAAQGSSGDLAVCGSWGRPAGGGTTRPAAALDLRAIASRCRSVHRQDARDPLLLKGPLRQPRAL